MRRRLVISAILVGIAVVFVGAAIVSGLLEVTLWVTPQAASCSADQLDRQSTKGAGSQQQDPTTIASNRRLMAAV